MVSISEEQNSLTWSTFIIEEIKLEQSNEVTFKKGDIVTVYQTFDEFSEISLFSSTEKYKVPSKVHSKIPICNHKSLDSLYIPINKFQKLYKIKKLNKALEEQSETREMIIEETIMTEESYVQNLLAILEYEEVFRAKNVLSSREHTQVFGNVQGIVEVNKILLNNLKNDDDTRSSVGSESEVKKRFSLGFISKSKSMTEEELMGGYDEIMSLRKPKISFVAAFKQIVPYLKIYSSYINNYAEATAVLMRATKENLKYYKIVNQMKNQNPKCRGQDLLTLLINPIQRIPRYALLLKELLKNTPKDHPEYDTLVSTLDEIKKVAEELNLKRSIWESQKLTHHVVEKFSLFCLETKNEGDIRHQLPHRTYVQHGELLYKKISKKKKVTMVEEEEIERSEEKMEFSVEEIDIIDDDILVIPKPKKEKDDWINVECFLYTDILLVGNVDEPDEKKKLKKNLYFHLNMCEECLTNQDTPDIIKLKFINQEFELKFKPNESEKWIKYLKKYTFEEKDKFREKGLSIKKLIDLKDKKKKTKEEFLEKIKDLNNKLTDYSNKFKEEQLEEKEIDDRLLSFLRYDEKFMEIYFKKNKNKGNLNNENIKKLKKKDRAESTTPNLKRSKSDIFTPTTEKKRLSINLKGGSFHEAISKNLQKVDKKTRDILKDSEPGSRNSISFNISKFVDKLTNNESKESFY
eukprot:gene5677-9498_t